MENGSLQYENQILKSELEAEHFLSILQDFSALVKSRTRIFSVRRRSMPPICTKCCKFSGNVGFVSFFAGSLIFKLVQFDVFPPFLVDEIRVVC